MKKEIPKSNQTNRSQFHLSLTLLLAALGKTLINLDRDPSGNRSPNLINLLAVYSLSKGTTESILVGREQRGRNDKSASILVREGSEGVGRLAVWVDLIVQSSLVEDSCFAGANLVPDDSGLAFAVEDAAFRNGLGVDAAGDDSEELRGARMGVDHDHGTAYPLLVSLEVCSIVVDHTWELGGSHTDTSACKSRERLACGKDFACAVETVEEVLVLREKLVAINGAVPKS